MLLLVYISYSIIQLMFLYTCTQFCNLIFTYYFASKITDFQFVYVDVCCLMPITIFICWIDPKPELVKYYPPNSLLDPRVFFSMIGFLVITVLGIIGIYIHLIHQSFYTPHIAKLTVSEENQESTTVFLFTLPLYIWFGLVQFTTSEFKESIFDRLSFSYFIIICYLLIQICITYWVILLPLPYMKEVVSLVTVPFTFRATIAISTIAAFILYMIYQHFLFAILNKYTLQKNKKTRRK